MPCPRPRVIGALLCSLASCSPPAPDLAGDVDVQVDVEAERAAVRAHWDGTNAALIAKDWERYQEFWLQEPSLQVIHPAQGDWIRGWDAFRERYESVLSSDTEFAVTTRSFDVELSPSADVAWATIEADLIVNGAASTHWYVLIARKVDGRWRSALALDSPPPADGTSAAAQ